MCVRVCVSLGACFFVHATLNFGFVNEFRDPQKSEFVTTSPSQRAMTYYTTTPPYKNHEHEKPDTMAHVQCDDDPCQ